MTKAQRFFSSVGAIFCLLAIMMSAYASHGLQDAVAQHRLNLAAAFAFMHGLSLIIFNAVSLRKAISYMPCVLMLLGVLLFSGSLALSAMFNLRSALAPTGGVCMMLAWLWIAISFAKGR
jgi:uncharacterized membrane protein YgdD (TMEM256/DUF423 family)